MSTSAIPDSKDRLDISDMTTQTILVRHQAQEVQFSFPNESNAQTHVQNILAGRDYPLVSLPSYSPLVIVDIGANVGATAVYFALHYPNATVYCFEPSASNYSYLRTNTAPFKNVVHFNFGLHAHVGTEKLYLGNAQCLQHSIFRSREVGEKCEDISIRRAADEFERIGIQPSILKIDTEGCEVPILCDLRSFIAETDVLYIEYHSESDRRMIDEVLHESHVLWWGNASMVHRGVFSYLSKSLIERNPQLAAWEIDSAKGHSL